MSDETITDALVVDDQPGTEVEPARVRLLPNPFTGEAIDLDDTSENLAKALKMLRDLDDERRQLVKDVSHELLQRMDQEAKWTLHFPGLDISGDTPNRREYSSERLLKVLEQLVAEKKITKEAAQAAIERNVTYKVKKRGVEAIKKLGGDVGKRIYGTSVPVPDGSRRVSVKAKEAVDA